MLLKRIVVVQDMPPLLVAQATTAVEECDARNDREDYSSLVNNNFLYIFNFGFTALTPVVAPPFSVIS